jgi:hypothetical protein
LAKVQNQGLSSVNYKEHFEITQILGTKNCISDSRDLRREVITIQTTTVPLSLRAITDAVRTSLRGRHIQRLQQLDAFPQRGMLRAYVDHLKSSSH